MIPLFWPPAQSVPAMIDNLTSTLSGRWWGQGPRVEEFEKAFGEKFGFKYPVFVNSGTAALHLAYVLCGIRTGDEVIIPVLTCTATCHPLICDPMFQGGPKIVFADIRGDTLTLDPKDLERKITTKTKAVVVVHLGGLVVDRKEIKRIVAHKSKVTDRPITIIEDAAQALGAGTVGFGDFTCFSFQAIKNLTTGDGGMLICSKRRDYERAKRLRWFAIDRELKARKNWQAWDRRGITFDQAEKGFKYQPTDIDAAIGLAGLQSFDRSQKHRRSLAKVYREELRGLKTIELLESGDSSNWLFMVKVKDRDEFCDHLLKNGIETNVAHLRNDIFTVFGGRRQSLPNMNEIEKKYICLPLNDRIDHGMVKDICKVIRQWERIRENKNKV